MPEWLAQFAIAAGGGVVSGLMILAGLRAEVRILKDMVTRATGRLDKHIDNHGARLV